MDFKILLSIVLKTVKKKKREKRLQATSKSSRDFICTIIRSFGGSKWRGKFEQSPSCGLPHRLINLLDRYLERSARRYPLPLSRSNKTDDNLLHVESPPFSNNRRINCFVKFRSNNNNTRISFENRMKGKFVREEGTRRLFVKCFVVSFIIVLQLLLRRSGELWNLQGIEGGQRSNFKDSWNFNHLEERNSEKLGRDQDEVLKDLERWTLIFCEIRGHKWCEVCNVCLCRIITWNCELEPLKPCRSFAHRGSNRIKVEETHFQFYRK